MIPKGLFAQISMVVISISIIFTYVEPAFSEIGAVQDDISTYREERKKVAAVNDQLDGLVRVLESVSSEDVRRLQTYLPNDVDEIAVPRDLAIMAVEAGTLYRSAAFSGQEDVTDRDPEDFGRELPYPQEHVFSFMVEGTYDQVKELFRLMERNNYPLEIQSLNIDRIDGGFLEVNMEVVTFAYQTDALSDEEQIF